jgi:hypothetical protein
VTGSAYTATTRTSAWAVPPSDRGPELTVTLAGDAANSPQDAPIDAAEAVYGPAVLFRRIGVHTEGALA